MTEKNNEILDRRYFEKDPTARQQCQMGIRGWEIEPDIYWENSFR